MISGSALSRSPISRSPGRIGVPTTSRTTRMPSSQTVCSRPAPGYGCSSVTWSLVGPRSSSSTTTGARRMPTAPSRELRISGRRVMPDSSAPRSSTRSVSVAVLVGGARRVPHLDDLVVAHQLARPLDQPDADQQQRDAQRRAQRDVGGAQPEDRLHLLAVGAAVDVEGEVGDDEQHGADRREAEQRATCRSARFSAFGSTSVGRHTCSGRPGLAIGSSRTSSPPCPSWESPSPGSSGRWVWSSVMPRPPPSSVRGTSGVGGDPGREADQGADADDPGEQALAHRAHAAEVEAAVLRAAHAASRGRR